MHVDVGDIEAVGERGCGSWGCGGAAGWAKVGGYVAQTVGGGEAAWELAAEAECRVR